MKNFFEVFVLLVLTFSAAVLFSFVTAWVVMLLWNWLMPEIFDISTITYWQAFGMMILSSMLFGGIKFNYNKTVKKNE